MSVAIILAIAAATQAAPVQSPLEIRFCPETKVWAYPLDSLRGAQGLLLQNVAIVNRGAVPVTLRNVSIELRSGPASIDERRFGPAQIEAAAKGASTALAQGMFKLAPFQFCDGRLIGNAPPAGGAVLQPGQALVLMQNLFAFKGKRRMAERVGFEPTVRLPVRRISSAVLSTTQPPLRSRAHAGSETGSGRRRALAAGLMLA